MLSRSRAFLSSTSSSKPVLPNIQHFIQSCRDVTDHLMKTQKEGFGVNLMTSMDLVSNRDVDAFVLTQNSKTSQDKEQHPLKLHPFTSFAQPFGCFASTVSDEHTDSTNHVHTGILATLADVQTSLHLWGLAGPKSLHVSVGIDLNFCAPNVIEAPRRGEKLLCLTRSPKVGKQLAFLEFSLYTINDETLEKAMMEMTKKIDADKNEKSNYGVLLAEERKSVGEKKENHHHTFHVLEQHPQISDISSLKNQSLAFQSSLLYLYGQPFATGWHEKAFIHSKPTN